MVLGEAKGDESTVILLGPGGQTNTDEPSGAIVVSNNGVSRFVSAAGNAWWKGSAGLVPQLPDFTRATAFKSTRGICFNTWTNRRRGQR